MSRVFIQGAGGIGTAMARGLLGRPEVERVFLSNRSGSHPDGLEADPRCSLLPLDLTDPASIEAAAERIRDEGGGLDALVNTSGILHDEARGLRPEKRIEALDAEQLAHSFAVNAIGPLLVAQACIPLFDREQDGVLANLSARVGSIGDNRAGGWYGYRASKAALNMLTKTLSLELARRAPRLACIALHPGTVDTPLSAPFQRGLPEAQLQSAELAAGRLLSVLDACTPSWNGGFRAFDGSEIPW